jgi:hypothetical protein
VRHFPVVSIFTKNTKKKGSVADPDPHHLAGSGIFYADLDPDPRLQNWHLSNLFIVEKYCE